MKRRRRPTTFVWALAAPFAILVGLAIGGLPSTATDVPLDARPGAVATTVPAGAATTSAPPTTTP